ARRVPDAAAVVVARLVELGIETAVKALVDRSRPVFGHPVATAGGAAFPSGHTAGSAALYGILVLLLVRRALVTVAATVFVLAVGASRVVLGVHYLSDVVGGLALGIAVAAGTVLLRDWATARFLVKKRV
ncbi:MAG TPA: phosphatase PAP2 family protein, partial [Pseudonocardiaceae bacterium]